MKYFLYWILPFFLYSFIGTTYAAETDPPVLNNISLDKSTVNVSNNSETVTFSLDVYDESGINRVQMWLYHSGGRAIMPQSTAENPTEISYTFDSSYPEGEYYFSDMSIYDLNGNRATYHASDLNVYGFQDVITVSNQQDSTWDFDRNNTLDALTDGLLLLRYAFGLRGEILTNAVIGLDSTLTTEEIEVNIEQALDIADIDNDGTVSALTDGLLLLRYFFGLRGEILVNDVVSLEATRTSASEIETYIESFMP